MGDYTVYSPFDLEQHKNTFINYLEVVVKENGEIEYAVPSHIEKLIALSKESREELMEMMPLTAAPIEWLAEHTHCINVWNNFYVGHLYSEAQRQTLLNLVDNGLLGVSRSYILAEPIMS